jgi:outer membrane receptor for ferrienterochelin and colicins
VRVLFIVLCMIVCTAILAAQEAPPGVIVRIEIQSDSTPVPDAIVTINGIATKTGDDGIVTVRVQPGNVDVAVSKPEFVPATASITVGEIQENHVVIELQPRPTIEEEITVSATRIDVRLQDVPIRVEVLEQEEIEEKVMMTPGDIVMMLNEMGGLRVQTTSPSLGAASVRIQGMKGRYTRFLSDGLPLFGQQVSGLGLLQIPPMDLGQVEVIKGVASALYGSGAMGGVVNLISRRPGDEPVYEFLVNQSTRGATDFVPFLAGSLSTQWKATLLGGAHLQQHNDIDHDGWADLAKYRRGIIRPRFFWDSGSGSTAFLTASATIENRDGGTVPMAVLPATKQPYKEALETRRYDIGGNAQFTISGGYLLAFRGAFAFQSHRHQFGNVHERDRHDALFSEASIQHSTGRHTWVAGIGLDRDAYRPRDVPQFEYDHVIPGVFGQDDIVITPWLSISTSARLDHHNRYGTFVSPRFSALFRARGWTSRLSVGQGFFGPTPLTEETEAAGLSRLQIPRPLKAERGRSASFDLTRTAGPGSYTVTMFASEVRDPLHVERETRYELLNLSGRSANIGVEFLATLRNRPFSVTTTYSFVQSSEHATDGSRVDTPLTPRHSVGIVGMWEKENTARIGIECYYTGIQRLEVNPYRSRSEPYVVVGALAERRFGHFRLFINAENLTNAKQTRWNPLLLSSQAPDGRWTVDAWAPLDGRVLNGGVRLMF